jgi:hypothetical protein
MEDIERPKETSEERAKRMWSNHDLTRRFLEEKHKPAPIVKTNPDMAEVLSSERPKADETTKFERKFIKDLRAMLEGHRQRNLIEYKRALRARIHRLKREKLKRLMAQHGTQNAQS